MKPIASIALVLALASSRGAQALDDTDPDAILKQTHATYEAMDSYRALGSVVSHVRAFGQETTSQTRFTLALGRPHLYRLTWSRSDRSPVRATHAQGGRIDGAVWNSGSGPFNYASKISAYAEAQSDEMALAAATGVSNGAAHTIPSVFFEDRTSILTGMTELELRGTDDVNGEECYIVAGKSPVWRSQVLWISKGRFVILKYQHTHQRSRDAAPGSITDLPEAEQEATLKQGLMAMRLPDTPEARARLKALMQLLQAADKLGEAGGAREGETTETYRDVVVNATSEADAYEFQVPAGTALKGSLVGAMFGVEEAPGQPKPRARSAAPRS